MKGTIFHLSEAFLSWSYDMSVYAESADSLDCEGFHVLLLSPLSTVSRVVPGQTACPEWHYGGMVLPGTCREGPVEPAPGPLCARGLWEPWVPCHP